MSETHNVSAADSRAALQQANLLILALVLLVLGLAAALAYMWIARPVADADLAALEDPEIRREMVARLAQENVGYYDVHVDADIGRTMAARLVDFEAGGMKVTTNRYGMREREYAIPKKPGTVRIVLLGDSFVFGLGVAADDRMGVFLEEELEARSPFTGEIEVLHFGVPSWNFFNEAAFLRRQLSELQPDLVLHFSLPNDIEDGAGTRGNGLLGRFIPRRRERADSVLNAGFPKSALGFSSAGYVRHGIDYEGRQRYAESVALLRHLHDTLETSGAGYRLFLHYRNLLRPVWQHLGRHMPDGSVFYIGKGFGNNKDYWVADHDHHWNRAGHLRMSHALYEVIRRDGLLPQLDLPPWDEAAREVEEILDAGYEEAAEGEQTEQEVLASLWSPKVASKIDFTELDDPQAAQIHTGIDSERLLSPYASFVLANDGASSLHLRGRALERPELDGGEVQIFIDEESVGSFRLAAGQEIDQFYKIPMAISKRPFLSIRIQSDDYVYQGHDYQHCVVLQLDSISLESD